MAFTKRQNFIEFRIAPASFNGHVSKVAELQLLAMNSGTYRYEDPPVKFSKTPIR